MGGWLKTRMGWCGGGGGLFGLVLFGGEKERALENQLSSDKILSLPWTWGEIWRLIFHCDQCHSSLDKPQEVEKDYQG